MNTPFNRRRRFRDFFTFDDRGEIYFTPDRESKEAVRRLVEKRMEMRKLIEEGLIDADSNPI